MKNLIKKENLTPLLIILLIGHNIFLQLKINDSITESKRAAYSADDAMMFAEEASNNSADASYYAYEAYNEANEAADNASDAYSYAVEAYNNSFGRQCWSCP